MTPRALAAFAELLDNVIDWIAEEDPGSLDLAIAQECGAVVLRLMARLVQDGAQ